MHETVCVNVQTTNAEDMNAGAQAMVADLLATNLNRDETLGLVRKLLAFYKENAKKKERTAKFVARVGIEAVKAAVLEK